jgi:hypothetical protein
MKLKSYNNSHSNWPALNEALEIPFRQTSLINKVNEKCMGDIANSPSIKNKL